MNARKSCSDLAYQLVTLPTPDLGEPKRPLMLQREGYDLPILDVHRLVRNKVESVPPTERFGAECERHLKVVPHRLGNVVMVGRMRGRRGVRRVWVLLDEVTDEDGRAFEPPVADIEALHTQRGLEHRYDKWGLVLLVCQEGEDLAVWEESEIAMVRDEVTDINPGVLTETSANVVAYGDIYAI